MTIASGESLDLRSKYKMISKIQDKVKIKAMEVRKTTENT